MNDRTPTEEVEDGFHADRLLNDPVFQDAVAQIKDRIIADWKNADTVQAREEAFARQQGLTSILKELRRVVTAGEFIAQMEKD